LISVIEQIAKQYGVEEIGISYAGQVDDGVILAASNIKVDEPNIRGCYWSNDLFFYRAPLITETYRKY